MSKLSRLTCGWCGIHIETHGGVGIVEYVSQLIADGWTITYDEGHHGWELFCPNCQTRPDWLERHSIH